MASEPTRRRQHLVSAGYQRNFADGVWVSILDAESGEILDARRSVKRNWYVDNFLSVVTSDDDVDDSLEIEFARHERVILNRVRDIEPGTGPTPEQKRALDLLAAIHFLRSVSYRDRQAEVVARWAAGDALKIATSPQLRARFIVERGRPPHQGELEAMVAKQASSLRQAPDRLADGVRHGVPKIDQLLSRWAVQLVVIDPSLPGLVLADHPILHGKRDRGQFGFEAAGAVGDADTIIVPIRRHLAACYCPSRLPNVHVRTKKGVSWINSLLLRGALKEVACHPSDALATSRLIRNLDRFPASGFNRAVIR